MWPSLNVTLNDVTLQDPKDRDGTNRLTAGSIQADITLASVWSGQPQITELVITRPVLYVPLLRERAGAVTASPRQASPPGEADANAPAINRVTIADGAVAFSNLRDRVENRIDGINAEALIGGDRKIRVTGSARAGEHPLKFEIKATAPAPPMERQNIPVELTLDAPGLLQAPLSAKAEVRLNGSVVMINGLTGTLGDGAFNGWASVDLASKPLVKLDLDFQRLDVALAKSAARSVRRRIAGPPASQPWSNATIDLTGLNYVDAQVRISAAELNIGEAHFAPAAIDAALGGGVLKTRFSNLGAYGGQASGEVTVDASTGQPDLRAAQRSRRRARIAAAAKCRRLRQARRQDAGEDRRAFRRQQPARHHVEPRRHRIRGVPGRRDPRPQRRPDDPLADLRPAVGMAGGQGANHRPDAARRLVPHREGSGHHQRSQSGRARW